MSDSMSENSTLEPAFRPFDTITKNKRPYITIIYKFAIPEEIDDELKNLLTNVWYFIYLSQNVTRSKVYEHIVNLGNDIRRNEMEQFKTYIKVEYKEHTKIEGIEKDGGILIKRD